MARAAVLRHHPARRPTNSTHPLATYAFDIAMGAGQFGLSASVALFILPALALLIIALAGYMRTQ